MSTYALVPEFSFQLSQGKDYRNYAFVAIVIK